MTKACPVPSYPTTDEILGYMLAEMSEWGIPWNGTRWEHILREVSNALVSQDEGLLADKNESEYTPNEIIGYHFLARWVKEYEEAIKEAA